MLCTALQVPQECPQALVDLIDECLNSPAAERPTATQLFERLRDIRRSFPPPAHQEAAPASVVGPPAHILHAL